MSNLKATDTKQPVVLNAQEVIAILHGDKTQHRVVSSKSLEDLMDDDIDFIEFDDDGNKNIHVYKCPYGELGDFLNLVGESSGRHIRLGLKITAIRIEQLQDISHKDAIAEGVEVIGVDSKTHRVTRYKNYPVDKGYFNSATTSFSELWNTKARGETSKWQDNPWVWVIEFEEAAD